MARRWFAVGCWILILLGLAHLLGHYAMVTSEGQGDAERRLLEAMRGDRKDLGLGFVRSTFDILSGFSLTFSILPAGMGLAGLALLRRERGAPEAVRGVAIVYAGVYGVMTAMAWRYWFPAPLAFLAVAFVCFLGAVITDLGR